MSRLTSRVRREGRPHARTHAHAPSTSSIGSTTMRMALAISWTAAFCALRREQEVGG